MWNGGALPSDVTIRIDAGTEGHDAPVALFGQATLTFHVAGLLRTSPGWSLWVSGSPNVAKDGIAPLSGLVETDWSPYTFTMNWRFTRANHWVRFEENEPFCFIFPVERSVVATVEPTFVPIEDAPELREQFETWSRSRDAFQAEVARNPPTSPSEKWQKLYYRGVDAHGHPGTADHMSKLRPHPFTVSPTSPDSAARCPVLPAAADAPGESDV